MTNSKGKKRKPGTKPLGQAIGCNDNEFVDFLSRCLEWNPLHRITPDEALKHSWMAVISKAETRQIEMQSSIDKSDNRKSAVKPCQQVTVKEFDSEPPVMSSTSVYKVYKVSKSSASKSSRRKEGVTLSSMLTKASSEESLTTKSALSSNRSNGSSMTRSSDEPLADSGTFLPPIL